MKTLTKRLSEVLAVAVLFAACVISAGQLSATAQEIEVPVCDGLECWDASDCGSKCFCNRPSSTCFDDTEETLN
jgi:hypothetical protein